MRWFQFAVVGSQTSIPMPAEVDGAPAGPGLPGPTWSFTKQRSFPAVGVVDVGVPVSRRESPFLNCFTNSTVVLASGGKAVFMESSQVSATGADAGAGVEGVDPPPPQPGSEITATSAVVAAANVRQVGRDRVRGLVFTTRWADRKSG